MTDSFRNDRRAFLKQAAVALGSAAQSVHLPAADRKIRDRAKEESASYRNDEFPRRFEGWRLRMISFPLGGVAAGSVSLGGRGQLRDWEILPTHRTTRASTATGPGPLLTIAMECLFAVRPVTLHAICWASRVPAVDRSAVARVWPSIWTSIFPAPCSFGAITVTLLPVKEQVQTSPGVSLMVRSLL